MWQVDYTIHVSDLAVVGAGVMVTWRSLRWAGTFVMQQRDFNRDISALLRGDEDRPGIMRDVREIKHELYEPGGAMYRVKSAIEDIKLALARTGVEIRRDPP